MSNFKVINNIFKLQAFKLFMENENEKQRAEIFMTRKSIVHVSKKDGAYYNGLILEVGDTFFVLKDRFEETEKFIFFNELKKPLELFTEADK